MEGNTISLPATVSIIMNGTLPMSGCTTVREFYEIINHLRAVDNTFVTLTTDDKLSVPIIKKIHADLTDRLQYDNGQFKKKENMILGAEFQTASPTETPMLVTQLVDNLQYRLETAKTSDDKLLAILDTHIQFERIHPFSGGNGVTGRMIMNYSLLKEDLPPLIIKKETKAQYIQLLATQDVASFVSFAKDTLKKETRRMTAFQNTEEVKMKNRAF